eukprot:Clim_evm18s25 gene=Clim_evmTU18s25
MPPNAVETKHINNIDVKVLRSEEHNETATNSVVSTARDSQMTLTMPQRESTIDPNTDFAAKTADVGCRLNLTFEDVTYKADVKMSYTNARGEEERIHKERRILDSVSGVVQSGELLAILGPSGSGKTTLLDILAQKMRPKAYEGVVRVNSCKPNRFFKRVSAYVKQDEALLPTLTVRETLMYAAHFRLPSDQFTDEQKRKIVEDTIDDLGLRIAADTKIGNSFIRGISGGQKRRVSIGVELVAQPCILFLDVPTSGLDSTAAMSLIRSLRALTRTGRTIVTTLNGPSNKMYQLFDKVMILSQGHMAYFGKPENSVRFFADRGLPCPEDVNPPDFFLAKVNPEFDDIDGDDHDIVEETDDSDETKESSGSRSRAHHKQRTAVDVAELAQAFKDSDYFQHVADEIKEVKEGYENDYCDIQATKLGLSSKFANSTWYQTKVLVKRNFQDAMRNPAVYWLRVGMYFILGIVIGTLFFDVGTDGNAINDRVSILFFVAAFMTFMTVAAVPAFVDERAVFVRERASGCYRPAAYTLANTLSSIPWVFLIALSSSIPVYWMVQLNPGAGQYFFFVLNLFLALYTAESFMIAISVVAPFALLGIAIAAMIFGFFMLMSGFFIVKSDIPDYWIWGYYISFHNYIFQSFLYNDFSGLTLTNVETATGVIPEMSGDEYISSLYGVDSDIRLRNSLIIIAMIVFWRMVFMFLLSRYQTGMRK